MSPVEPVGAEAWQRFTRVGTVIAERRAQPWSWTTHSGAVMHAGAGDWLVRESEDDEPWSVRDDIFRATYTHLRGNRWRRSGTVLARRARDGETIDTLEGPVPTRSGDWVVRGDTGEQWPVRAAEFAKRYALGPRD